MAKYISYVSLSRSECVFKHCENKDYDTIHMYLLHDVDIFLKNDGKRGYKAINMSL